MIGKRKRHSADFKAKVALEALKGELSLSQLATKHGVHQTMIAAWRKQAVEGLAGVFSGRTAAGGAREGEIDKLHVKIGQLVAERDFLATRKGLSWRLSNSMDAEFCIATVEEALARYGPPGIFNTHQGSQFTSPRFVDALGDAGVRVSTDGRGRWMDNVFIERLWRSLKYECVSIDAFETGLELRAGLTRRIGYDNADRPHSALAGATPDEAHGHVGSITGDRLAA